MSEDLQQEENIPVEVPEEASTELGPDVPEIETPTEKQGKEDEENLIPAGV